MITKITVKPNSHESQILLFDKAENLKRLNLLFGANSSGKTTFIRGLVKGNFEVESSKEYEVMEYTNSVHNYRHNNPMGTAYDYTEQLVNRVRANQLSEGQSIMNSIVNMISDIEERAEELSEEDKWLVVLLDEVDSGLSVENIDFLCRMLDEIGTKNDNIQYFISFNNYYFIHCFKKALSMYTGKWIEIKSFEEYCKHIFDWRERLFTIRSKFQNMFHVTERTSPKKA